MDHKNTNTDKEPKETIDLEKKFALLIRNTDEIVVLVDKKFKVIDFNDQFRFHYSKYHLKPVVKGSSILDHTEPSKKDEVKKIYEKVFYGEVDESTIELVFQNTTIHTFLNKCKPAFDENNEIVGAFVSLIDITEKKSVQLKLKESYDLLEKLTTKVPLAIYKFEIGLDGKMSFPFISNEIKKIIPNLNIELLKEDASSAFEDVHPEDLEKLFTSIEISKNNLSDWELEYRSIVDNDNTIWLKGKSTPEKMPDGSVVWFGYLQDITEQKNSNEAIRISNERYNIIAKATNDTIWDWDLLTNTIIWNKGIHGIFGYKNDESEMDVEWWFSKIHPEDEERVRNSLEFIFEKKESRWENEYRFCCADGTYKYVYDRGFLIVNESVPVRMIGAMQDITERKKEEHQLKLLESVITNANDAVVITKCEPFDKPGARIVYVNEAFTKMTGYSQEEVIGKSPRFLRGVNSDKQELKRLSEAFRKHKPCEITTINYKKNGEEFWINLSVSPVSDEKGKVTHWISIERDISQRKYYELEREQLVSELSQNNKDLKQFSYVISHNLRAPIANLLGLSNLIDRHEIPDGSLKKILNGIKQSALIFDETVKDLNELLVIKDQSIITKEELSLTSVVTKIITQLSIELEKNDVKINYEFNSAPTVIFTGSYLESIFINLFTNSLKYKSPQRKLQIDINSEDTQDYVVVKFKDNGIGLDVELHREKLFKLYQRFHEHSEGKGLGLYLVKSQMEALGGTIDVESVVGKGTTFILKFKKHPQ